jgi:cytidine deaminase
MAMTLEERQGPSGPRAALLAAALAARANAYARYSGFAVGAAVLTEAAEIFAGANVENVSYPVGTCAEAGAVAAMVAAGGRRIVEALVVSAGGEATPCGACRQRLREFADDSTPIHTASLDGIVRTSRLGTLLPEAFTAFGRKGSQEQSD